MRIHHARRWSAGIAVALVAFGLTALTPSADAANPPVTLSPTSGPAGTTTTVTLPSPCGSASNAAFLFLSATRAGGGTGGGYASVNIPPGTFLGSTNLVLAADSPAGPYFVEGVCSSDTFTTYGRAVFDVTGGPALPPLTVTPSSGPTGTAVDVAGECAPGTEQPLAVLSVAMFSPSDPENVAYGSAQGVGPVLHASLTVPSSFPSGPVTISASCSDYYATQYAFMQSSFTVTGGGGLSVTASASPRTVTAGNLARTHFSIKNAGPDPIGIALAGVSVPAGALPISITPSRGLCSGFSGGHATCLLGGIAAGGSRGVDVVFVTPPGSSGPFLATIDVLAGGGASAHGSAGPTVVAARQGYARGFVPPGGSISIGRAPTAANPVVATFELPNTGSGAPITLRVETKDIDTFCAGEPCAGKILYLSPFTGYDDPRNPPELKIVWDESVVTSSTTFPIYVQKVADGPVVTIPNCTDDDGEHHDVADPSPCVEKRVRRSNDDVETHILLLSGDPRFARR